MFGHNCLVFLGLGNSKQRCYRIIAADFFTSEESRKMHKPNHPEEVETYAKQSRLWLNAGLLLLVFALALLIWLKPDSDDAQSILLLDLSPKDVNTIRITPTTADTPVITLQKEGDIWLLEEPLQKKAKAEKVAHLLTLLMEESLSRYPSAGRNLAQYQLDPGLIKVSFNDTELIFGMSNPMNYQRYILKDNTIHLVNETVFSTLSSPAEHWLDNKAEADNTAKPAATSATEKNKAVSEEIIHKE